MYEVRLSESAAEELDRLRAYDRRPILQAIEQQLSRAPDVPTRTKKMLKNLTPPFPAIPPIWQLRVGEYRIFYDVDLSARAVYVRAIRRKPPHKTTEEIL